MKSKVLAQIWQRKDDFHKSLVIHRYHKAFCSKMFILVRMLRPCRHLDFLVLHIRESTDDHFLQLVQTVFNVEKLSS